MVGEDVSFAHLKGVLHDFLRRFFEADDLEVRSGRHTFRSPSRREVDIRGERGWLEVLGSGMGIRKCSRTAESTVNAIPGSRSVWGSNDCNAALWRRRPAIVLRERSQVSEAVE